MICSKQIENLTLIPAGVKNTSCKVITSNRHFFAYASFYSVYVYEHSTFRFVKIITSANSTIATISLCSQSDRYLAISFANACVMVYDLILNFEITRVIPPHPLKTICWTPDDQFIIGFSDVIETMYFFSPYLENGEIHSITFLFRNTKIAKTVRQGENSIFIFGCEDGKLIRLDFNLTKFDYFSGNGKIKSIDFDPFNSCNCLTIWSSGEIILFDISNGFTEIHRTCCEQQNFSTATFLSSPPGHFLTGSSDHGYISLFSSVSEEPIEKITIGNYGLVEMERAKNDTIILGFKDGLIMIYDIINRCKLWETKAGHSNTIFNVQFFPNNNDILCSCGAEGSVCTWNVDKMEQIDRFCDNNELFICMVISPGGGYIVCGCDSGSIIIFSVKNLIVAYKKQIFENERIGNLDCSKHRPELLLVCSQFGKVVIFDISTRKIVWKPDPSFTFSVFSACFSPHDDNSFALACNKGILAIVNDGIVNIYTSDDTENLYSVQWSPFEEMMLLTSSNSGNVTIWRLYAESKCATKIVCSHGERSRPVVFHPTIDWLAASGGYDGFINIFDLRTGKVLLHVGAHFHHIYGLTFSEKCPSLLISSSRDTTIKFWSFDYLLIESQLPNIFTNTLNNIHFRPLEGLIEFENLLGRIIKDVDRRITPKLGEMVHLNDSLRISAKRISRMLSAAPHETSLIKKAIKSRERMLNAAKISLLSGKPKKYCELMFAAGEYDKALVAAPSVSYEFWKNLMIERIKLFETDTEIANGNLIIGDKAKAVELLDGKNAFIVSATEVFPSKTLKIVKTKAKMSKQESTDQIELENNGESDEQKKNKYFDFLFQDNQSLFEYEVASETSLYFLRKGKIYRAASSFLVVGDILNAISVLQRNGELFAAAFLANKFNIINRKMAKKLVNISENAWKYLPLEMKAYTSSLIKNIDENELNQVKNFLQGERKESEQDFSSMLPSERMLYLVKSGDYKSAIELGINFLTKTLQMSIWDFCIVNDILETFELIQSEYYSESQLILLNAYDFYVATFKCFWRGHNSIIYKIIEAGERIAYKKHIEWLLDAFQKQRKFYESDFTGKNGVTIVPVGYDMLGATYITLEDGITNITKQEALIWEDVTTFSPTGSTKRLYVF